MKGRNRQGCPVFFDGDIDELKGELVPVRITEAFNYYLVGEAETNKFAGGRFVDDGESVVLERSTSHPPPIRSAAAKRCAGALPYRVKA